MFGAGKIVLVLGKGEVARLRLIGRSKAFEHEGRVADKLAGQVFGDFSGNRFQGAHHHSATML